MGWRIEGRKRQNRRGARKIQYVLRANGSTRNREKRRNLWLKMMVPSAYANTEVVTPPYHPTRRQFLISMQETKDAVLLAVRIA